MIKIVLFITFIAITIFNSVIAQTVSSAPYCGVAFDDLPFPLNHGIRSVAEGGFSNAKNAAFAFQHNGLYNNPPVPSHAKASGYTNTFNISAFLPLWSKKKARRSERR